VIGVFDPVRERKYIQLTMRGSRFTWYECEITPTRVP
jgi:hypothetical protein